MESFVIPALMALTDRVGRRTLYLGSAVFAGLMAFPFFWLIDTKQAGMVALAVVLGVIGHTAVFAGGLSPFIATALLTGPAGAIAYG